jgi:sn1-specific diacylglycerol lipase
LGAGTAVILSLKLKKEYPNVRCIAYSPPGGLISKDLADYSRSFIMSVIVGDDIVPRLSIRSVHNLKADILKVNHINGFYKPDIFVN